MSAEHIRAHLFVSGRVQGVFFRQSAKHKARALGVTGWVRNLIDGRVEIMCEGEKEKVEEFIEWARNGPPLANVTEVAVEYEPAKGEWGSFEIREFGF